MLEDRLSTAGLALREAPVPEPSLDGLAARRHRRTTRRLAVATVVTAVVAVVGLGALRTIERQPVRVVNGVEGEIRVPAPEAPRQPLPRTMPKGWSLSSWSELGAGIAGNPRVWTYTDGSVGFATHPYAALLDNRSASLAPLQPTDQTVLVHGAPSRIATSEGVRHVNFQLGGHILTVIGSQVDDESLRRIAEGVVEDASAPGDLRATWLPDGLSLTTQRDHAMGGALGSRTFTWTSPGATATLTTTFDDEDVTLEQLLWLHPGTGGETVDGIDYGLRHDDATTWRYWVPGRHVGATLATTGLSDDDGRRLFDDLVERTPQQVAAALDGVLAASEGAMPQRRQLTPSVMVYDDTVDGTRRTATAYLASGVGGVGGRALCWWHGGTGGCTEADALLVDSGPWLQLSGSNPDGAWFVAKDGVAEVAVHYAGQPTRVYPVVRPFPDVAAVVWVARPAGSSVDWVEARTARGMVLSRSVGPPTP